MELSACVKGVNSFTWFSFEIPIPLSLCPALLGKRQRDWYFEGKPSKAVYAFYAS